MSHPQLSITILENASKASDSYSAQKLHMPLSSGGGGGGGDGSVFVCSKCQRNFPNCVASQPPIPAEKPNSSFEATSRFSKVPPIQPAMLGQGSKNKQKRFVDVLDFGDKILRFTSTSDTRDRIYKLFQYVCKLFRWRIQTYLSSLRPSEGEKKAGSFLENFLRSWEPSIAGCESSFSSARKSFRLFYFLNFYVDRYNDAIEILRGWPLSANDLRRKDSLEIAVWIVTTFKNWAGSTYYVLDNLNFLSKVGLFDQDQKAGAERAKLYSDKSLYFSLMAICGSIILDTVSLLKLLFKEQALRASILHKQTFSILRDSLEKAKGSPSPAVSASSGHSGNAYPMISASSSPISSPSSSLDTSATSSYLVCACCNERVLTAGPPPPPIATTIVPGSFLSHHYQHLHENQQQQQQQQQPSANRSMGKNLLDISEKDAVALEKIRAEKFDLLLNYLKNIGDIAVAIGFLKKKDKLIATFGVMSAFVRKLSLS